MTSPATRVEVAALTHQGKVRPHNEDCVVVGEWIQSEPMSAPRLFEASLDAPMVCMVLDGLGGHSGGEVAAREAGRFLAGELPECSSEIMVARCIGSANAFLYQKMKENRRHRSMGATLAGVRAAKDRVLVFNVGDSRIYRVQDGFLSQLSVDDVPAPRPGPPELRTGVVTQSLGGAPRLTEIAPHVARQASGAPRTYLICSDGLYDALELDAMEAALDDDLGGSVSRLFRRALEAGARDNVSIILLRLAA